MNNKNKNENKPHKVIDSNNIVITVMPNKKTAQITASYFSLNEPQLRIEPV